MNKRIKMLNQESFSFFVTSVLRQISAQGNKDIYFNEIFPQKLFNSKRANFTEIDAYAPNGFETIETPVIFEIYYAKAKKLTETVINKRIKAFSNAVQIQSTIVIITNSQGDQRNRLSNHHTKKTEFDIIIWDESVLENWINSYPIDFINSISTYNEKYIKETRLTEVITQQDFEDKSQNNVRSVKQLIDDHHNFAIVLGAGVSKDPGAKSWNELLDYFRDELVKQGSIYDSEKLCNKIGGSSLFTAQLCQELYGTEQEYHWAIHNGLYSGDKPIDMDYPIGHVTRIIDKCAGKKNFRVLSYNYDNYLEQYLDHKRVAYNSLYDSNCVINENLSIYHVHGFLPKVKFKSYMTERQRASVYLTEANYNEMYNHPYSWQISSQLSFFRENTCLFVGCSLADPNIRRLLEMTTKESRTHYAILTKDNLIVNDLIKASNHFAGIGIEVIWAEDFLDVRRHLEMLYS